MKCKAITKDGHRCSKNAIGDHGYCSTHFRLRCEDDDDIEEMEMSKEPITTNTIVNTNVEQNALVLSLIETMNSLRLDVTRLEEKLEKKKNRRQHARVRMLYYHEQKNNPEILKIARDELNKSEGYAKLYENKRVPWQLVKNVTDSMFERLSDDAKNEYYSRLVE